MRLKLSVIERKARISGPAGIRRHERLLQAAHRRHKQNSTLSSTYEENRNCKLLLLVSISKWMVGVCS